MANRSERRSWDKYVKEARDVFTEIDLGEEGTIRVGIPTSAQMERFSENESDLWVQIGIIMGDENGEKLKKVAADAPVTALRSLIADVMADLNLSDDRGE